MENLKECSVLKFRADTLHSVRKMYDLDKPCRMEEAVDILDEWIKKQNHFICKDFDRSYLERIIICSKGSVETAKSRLDNLCTARTMMSEFYEKCENEERHKNSIFEYAVMPNLTPEGQRIFICRIRDNQVVTDKTFPDMVIDCIFDCEYIMKNDYNTGLIGVLDFRSLNLMDAITKIDLSLYRKAHTVIREGYGFRITALHYISGSKFLENCLWILTSALPAKIANRMHIHNTHETLHEFIPKELVSEEYGGNAPPLSRLNEIRLKAITSEEFLRHMKKINQCRTDESKRIGGKPNIDYLHGTFRNLTVD